MVSGDWRTEKKLSKEEKEKIVNERIEAIRKKNELLKKRYEEVQNDKKQFDSSKNIERNGSPDQGGQYKGKLESDRASEPLKSDRASELWKGKGRGRGRGKPVYNQREAVIGRQSGSDTYDSWRAERERIDKERLNRQKTTDGNWKREWDQDKIIQREDYREPQGFNGDDRYQEYTRRPSRNKTLGDYMPQNRGEEGGKSFYRRRQRSSFEDSEPISPEKDNERDKELNEHDTRGRNSDLADERGPRNNRRWSKERHERSPRKNKKVQGREDKTVKIPMTDLRDKLNKMRLNKEDDQVSNVLERQEVARKAVRAKIPKVSKEKRNETTKSKTTPPPAQATPIFDLKSPVQNTSMAIDPLVAVLHNESLNCFEEPVSLNGTEQPSSIVFEGEFFEDDYLHEHFGDSFEDTSKSWQTESDDESEGTDDGKASIPNLVVKSAAQTSKDRQYDESIVLKSVKEMMVDTFKQFGGDTTQVLQYGDLIGLKSPTLSYGWGAHGVEDIQTLQHFMSFPFFYYHSKDEYTPEGKFPTVIKQEMALSLVDFNQAFYVDNLKIKTEVTREEIMKFADVAAQCFSIGSDVVRPLFELLNNGYILGYQRGHLAGGVVCTVIGESSIIYFNSVLPKYRGQSISKALIAEAVRLAKKQGAKQMVLLSTEMGEPVYKALGFKYVREWTGSLINPIQVDSDFPTASKDDILVVEGDKSGETSVNSPQVEQNPVVEHPSQKEEVFEGLEMTKNEEAIDPLRMSTTAVDQLLKLNGCTATKYGPWSCLFTPEYFEMVEVIYSRFSPTQLDVHFRPDEIPNWATNLNLSTRYSMTCDLANVDIKDNDEFITVPVENPDQIIIAAQISAQNFKYDASLLNALEDMYLAAIDRNATVLLVQDGVEAVGCGIAEYEGSRAAVYFFSVNEKYRRRGIGTKLIRRIVCIAKSRGMTEAVLLAEGDDARRVYEKAGFKVYDTWSTWNFRQVPEGI
ncbi:hypothetical protein QYM36_013013 [Artemia franciscana]|uniref:N-acetyltransferase domain-containing protein n=1 Tax=Artemia franciscana TaxID=6661 RepID=A0AA88HF81_ARTSF|nr:hypothetical protein QYM36_013013 [Artemia franciscana]